jgi:hypothetical protein
MHLNVEGVASDAILDAVFTFGLGFRVQNLNFENLHHGTLHPNPNAFEGRGRG